MDRFTISSIMELIPNINDGIENVINETPVDKARCISRSIIRHISMCEIHGATEIEYNSDYMFNGIEDVVLSIVNNDNVKVNELPTRDCVEQVFYSEEDACDALSEGDWLIMGIHVWKSEVVNDGKPSVFLRYEKKK